MSESTRAESAFCSLAAFWPVADTAIGRLGIMMADEGSYPENARALALTNPPPVENPEAYAAAMALQDELIQE